MENDKPKLLPLIFRRDIVTRSLVIAVVVGTILNLINQGDVLSGSVAFNWIKCILTYMVPYCVSTYGAVTAILSMNKMSAEAA